MLKKLLYPALAGLLGIGGTTAVTTDVLDGVLTRPHTHQYAPVNHDHNPPEVEIGQQMTIDDVVHYCLPK